MTKTGLALSIRQPWAWLILRPDVTDVGERIMLQVWSEIKDVENRDWKTSVRGVIGIHASKTFDSDGYEWVRSRFPTIPMPEPDGFELGGVIGRAEVVDCVTECGSLWFFGKYGFVLRNAEPLPFMPCRGMPGFFKPEISDAG